MKKSDIKDVVTVAAYKFREEWRMNTLSIHGENLQGAYPTGYQNRQKDSTTGGMQHRNTAEAGTASGQNGIKMIGDTAYRMENGQLTAIGQEWDRTKGPANLRFSDPVSGQNKAKDPSLEKVKLAYNNKKISSIIRSSKTLASARTAVSKAKFEVTNLKKKRGNAKYDQDEVEIAINHAMAMERIAEKHRKNIETEEFAKRSMKSHFSQVSPETLEEAEKDFRRNDWERETMLEGSAASSTMAELMHETGAGEPARHYPDAQIDWEDSSPVAENLEKYMKEASSALESFAEGELMDMAQDLLMFDDDFNEDDYKQMVLRHRNAEQRETTKADMQYMKDYMEYFHEKPGSGFEVAMSSYLC